MNLDLFAHNKTAYENAAELLDREGKAAIVHPTGTGKSFIGFALCADHPEARVLGLSATNIRYLDNRRDMAAELFDGNIASEMTLGEAIVRGILNPPKYVMTIYKYQADLQR